MGDVAKNKSKKENLVGQVFGRLTVIRKSDISDKPYSWYCKCSCGNPDEILVTYYNLKSGATKSCGCYQKERASEANITHYDSKSKLYMVWSDMRHRCNIPSHHAYQWYGGKGIKVCEDWNNDYTIFREWAISSGYKEGLTIDRIDADKNYCPENCEWATRQQQSSHLTSCHFFDFLNKKYYVAQFCKEFNISKWTFYKYTDAGQSISNENIMLACSKAKGISEEKWNLLCNEYKKITGKEFLP